MKDKKQTFIRTRDTDTISRLTELGFVRVNEDSGYVTFLNDTSLNFDKNEIHNMKMTFTNMLCM